MSNNTYRNYRKKFMTESYNQNELKKYFKAKDIIVINWERIEKCNERLKDIFKKLHNAIMLINKSYNININEFVDNIDSIYHTMKDNNIIEKLNNNGRSPDDVYYNWMRGYLVCKFFLPTIEELFKVEHDNIQWIGDDNFKNSQTFKKSPSADLMIKQNGSPNIRLEIQSGFTGQNDIKKSKIEEAVKRKKQSSEDTYVIHFDLFNGIVAVIKISNFNNISETEYHKKYENTDVLKIKEEWFKWNFTEKIPSLNAIEITEY